MTFDEKLERGPGAVQEQSRSRRDVLRSAARGGRHERGASPCREPGDPTPANRGPVFISYARKDLDIVRPLVDRLQSGGAEIVWDQDFPSGPIDELLTAAIELAACVLVVWSPAARQSVWVIGEATFALKAGKLVSTYVHGFDVERLPIVFSSQNSVPMDDPARVSASLARHGVSVELPAP